MRRRVLAGLLAVWLLLALTACGGSKSASTASYSTADAAAPAEAAMEYGGGVEYEEAQYDSGTGETRGQKLICTAQLEMETTAFEEATSALADLTEQFGGYFESSSIGKRGSGSRWADYTIRVPAERYQSFLNQAGELCHETWRSTTQEDVSEAYYDTEGRLKTQQIKLERLQALLAKAEKMEDIITIESAISETEQTIDDLSGTLRRYDGKVNYATVYITLSEVYKLSTVEEVPDSFGTRLGTAFSQGLANFVDGLENLAVALAYGWLWVLVLAVVVFAAVRVLRKRRRTRRDATEKKPDDKPE
ncbi:MAG: DUF4349 domain-containing protein [Dysosmobacter sp.]|nr:DUF4349 domain-containing protein [Dysosmobacter sp.]